MKSYIPKQILVTGVENNKNKFYFNVLFVFSTIRCFSDEKLAKLDSSTASWIIMSFTEITIVENQNFCNTKLTSPESSTTSCLICLIRKF